MRRLAALALVAWTAVLSACTAREQTTPTRPPNLLLVVVDTLRSDFLHAYGFPRETSPTIDALARDGWLFESHYAHSTHTVPSTLSLLLSQLPGEHGFVPPVPKFFSVSRPVFPPELRFLAEVLRDAGYATAGFVANPHLTERNAFDQGFETFGSLPLRGADIARNAIDWLRAWDGSRPFHLYLHTMDAHQPYDPPAAFRERFAPGSGIVLGGGSRALPFVSPQDIAYTRDVYAAAVAYTDDCIARVLREIEARGALDDTIVVVTSDHGEELGDHGGIGHGRSLYAEVVRIPLVIRFPRGLPPGRRVAHLSQHLDLAPTLLRLAGLDVPESFVGASVLEPAPAVHLEIPPWRGIVRDGWKLVWNTESGEQQLFSLADALDREPRDEPEIARSLRAEVERFEASRARRPMPAAEGAAWTDDELARLRALGYVQ